MSDDVDVGGDTDTSTESAVPFNEESLIDSDRPVGERTGPPKVSTGDPGDEDDSDGESVGLDPEIADHLRSAGLRPVDNETNEQALKRLNRHWSGRAQKHYDEIRSLRTESNQQLLAMRQMVEPILRAEYQRHQQAEREALMAQIPEPGTPEHQEWLTQQILRNQLEQQQTWQQQQIAQQQAWQQQQQQAALLASDSQALDELATVLDSDPDAASAYAAVTELGFAAAQDMYPDATPAQVEEFVRLSQLMDLRAFRDRGMPVADALKSSYQRMARAVGIASSNGSNGNANGNGSNGHATAVPQGGKKPAGGSPTAARQAAAHAQEQARRVVSPIGRGGGPSGQGLDLTNLSEEEYVTMRLNGTITDEMQARAFTRPGR